MQRRFLSEKKGERRGARRGEEGGQEDCYEESAGGFAERGLYVGERQDGDLDADPVRYRQRRCAALRSFMYVCINTHRKKLSSRTREREREFSREGWNRFLSSD